MANIIVEYKNNKSHILQLNGNNEEVYIGSHHGMLSLEELKNIGEVCSGDSVTFRCK